MSLKCVRGFEWYFLHAHAENCAKISAEKVYPALPNTQINAEKTSSKSAINTLMFMFLSKACSKRYYLKKYLYNTLITV
jgi:hypothetical protein